MAHPVRQKRLWFPARGHRSAGFANGPYLTNANSGGALGPASGVGLSFAVWVKFDTITASATHQVLHWGTGTPTNDVAGLQLNGSNGQIELWSSNGSVYSVVDAGSAAVAGKWYLCICQCHGTGNSLTIYDSSGVTALGGVVGSSGIQVVNKPLYIGATPGVGSPLIGEVDSLGIWPADTPSTLLNPSGASNPLWNGGKAIDARQVLSIDSTHLAAFYNFDNPNGAATWSDDSGNGNTLTASGFVMSQRGEGY